MLQEEDAIELVLLVYFYGVRSSGGLCMAAVIKLIDFARKLKLENVAKVLENAYVYDCNSSVVGNRYHLIFLFAINQPILNILFP